MRATPTQQRNSFSEGLALGLVLNGCRALPYNKPTLDLAVSSAFRGWAHATSFPQVGTALRKGLDGTNAITRVDERKGTFAFYWDATGPELRIVSRDPDWSEHDPDDISYALDMIGGDIPCQAWEDLARAVLERLVR